MKKKQLRAFFQLDTLENLLLRAFHFESFFAFTDHIRIFSLDNKMQILKKKKTTKLFASLYTVKAVERKLISVEPTNLLVVMLLTVVLHRIGLV